MAIEPWFETAYSVIRQADPDVGGVIGATEMKDRFEGAQRRLSMRNGRGACQSDRFILITVPAADPDCADDRSVAA
jgi:hypothetical protein